MYAHKRIVSVTLDIECYDDLELENLDWREVLDLQGDEKVHVNIKELLISTSVQFYDWNTYKYSFVTVVELHTKCPIRIRDGVLLFLWVENVTYFPTNSFHK